MSFEWIYRLWNDNTTFKWWQMLLIGLFFLLNNSCLFIAMWYLRKEIAIEYGYPKRNKKNIKKRMASYTFIDHLLLIRISQEAERKGIMLYINLICHCSNILAFIICFVGFIGCMVTLGDGWSITLLILPEISVLFITGIIEFIPHFIWLPSVRRKYKIFK